MATKGSKSISGTEIKVGDTLMSFGWNDHQIVTNVEQGRHELGAKFAIVTVADGRRMQCWEGFKYQILVDR